jgi:hypothetical protein
VWHSKVDIENRITQPQYQALALLVNALTGAAHNPQPTFQDYHMDKDKKLITTK